jgi:hypothetical protein
VSGRARLGRHDHPGLCAVVVPLEAEVGRETHRLTVELLGAAIQQTLDLVRGLGLSALLSDDAPGGACCSPTGPATSTPA